MSRKSWSDRSLMEKVVLLFASVTFLASTVGIFFLLWSWSDVPVPLGLKILGVAALGYGAWRTGGMAFHVYVLGTPFLDLGETLRQLELRRQRLSSEESRRE